MGYLNGKTTYLAGAMHATSDDGVGWRDEITPKLKYLFNLNVEDPCKKTANGFGEVADDKKFMKELIKQEKWEEVREKFYPIVRKDLRCVDKCDFIVSVYDAKLPMFGTINEMVVASWQKKPILVKYSRQQLDVFNPWITCLVKPQWFFHEWDDMFAYLHKINSGVVETSHWGLE